MAFKIKDGVRVGLVDVFNNEGTLLVNAPTATKLLNARNINGVAFDGTANITITASTTEALTFGTGLTGTAATFNGGTAVTVSLPSVMDSSTAAKTPGTFGSSTAVPVVTVDAQGRITSVTTQSVSSDLNIADDSGSIGAIDLRTETLTLQGGEGMDVSGNASGTFTISGEDATTSNKGIASFSSSDFSVSSGAVSLVGSVVKSVTTDSGALTPSSNAFSILGGEGMDVTHAGTTITVAGELATAGTDLAGSNRGIAAFSSADFNIVDGFVTINSTSNTEFVQDTVGAMVDSNTESGIAVTYDDATGKLNFDVADFTLTIDGDVDGNATVTNLGNTTVTVTLDTVNSNIGSFGSGTAIPVITVNGKGLVTAVTTASVATTLGLAGDTGTDTVNLLTGTLTFTGTDPIDTAVANDTVTISIKDATTTTKGAASFNTDDFNVSSGAVELKDTVVKGLTVDADAAVVPSSHSVKITGGEGIDVTVSGAVITVAGELATANTSLLAGANPGVAAFDSANFEITDGFVGIKAGGVANSELANSSVTFGSTTVSLGATSTSIAGVTQLTVDNIDVNGNTISSTDANGNIVLDPNGTGTVDVSSAKITNVGTPTSSTDAATKGYVDSTAQGLDVKESVRAATTGNISLDNTTTTIDGVSLANGNRVLVKDQSTASENGIYIVSTSGSWSRAADADNTPGSEVTSGMFTFVEEGTVNADSGWVLTTNDPITLGSTNLSFSQFSGAGQITAGDGLSKSGNTLSVNVAANGGIEIVADNLQLKSGVAGAGLTYTTGVIDVVGTADRITVNADSIDIASTYVGQSSITTLGTVTTGTWQATVINPTYGGTGVNNGSSTITLNGANLTLTGADNLTFATTDVTSVTLPTTGTLATLAGAESLTNKTIDSSNIGATTPGTGNFTTLEADSFTLTDGTDSTSPTTGALKVTGGVGIAEDLHVGEDVVVRGQVINATSGGTVIAHTAGIQASVATTSATAIDSWAIATYRSAKYIVQITQGSAYQVSEVMVIHDGSTTTMTEFAVLETGSPLGTITAAISGGNAELRVAMSSATAATINIQRVLMAI